MTENKFENLGVGDQKAAKIIKLYSIASKTDVKTANAKNSTASKRDVKTAKPLRRPTSV